MAVGEDSEQGPTWRVEQRYRAVLEVLDGSPVSEVAVRYGVSRQTIYTWKSKYSADGLEGLQEKSRRPRSSPTRIPAEVEALTCEMRRANPRWGARRIAFEIARTNPPPLRDGQRCIAFLNATGSSGTRSSSTAANTGGGSARHPCICGRWSW
ncbi:helix-turn-helix domain-containing protein [Streptomyces sp. NPDC088794]|uniref:helix-turn-helix domain-containing protein n=1 Tax=Streptomyces sp. NPDC088794 TaxID=3365902 RepID=UPI003812B535